MDRQTTKMAELTGIKLMQASELIQDSASALFKQHGLSAPQYNVLRILRGAGADGLSCHQISARMVKRVPDITRLLDRLESGNLVSRERSQADRRVVMANISAAGEDLLGKIDKPLDGQVQVNFQGLDLSDLQVLDNLLERILAGQAK